MSPWPAEAPEPHAQAGTWLEPDGPPAAAAARSAAAAAGGRDRLGAPAAPPERAGGLLPLRPTEPGLGDRLRRRGALLVHPRLVVALDQHFGLGLQLGELRIGGGQLALLGAERRLM